MMEYYNKNVASLKSIIVEAIHLNAYFFLMHTLFYLNVFCNFRFLLE